MGAKGVVTLKVAPNADDGTWQEHRAVVARAVVEAPLPEVIACKDLTPGYLLRQALFTRQGIKLLGPGTRLSEALCGSLRASGEPVFVVARNVTEVSEAIGAKDPVQPTRASGGVRTNAVATEDLVTSGGVVAVERGERIEEHHADALNGGPHTKDGASDSPATGWTPGQESIARGQSEPSPAIDQPARAWAVRHNELARVRAAMLKAAENVVAEKARRWDSLPREVRIGIEMVAVSENDEPGWPDDHELALMRAERVGQVRGIYADLLRGLPTSTDLVLEIADELIALAARYPRRFTGLAMVPPRRADYLPDHALTTASLCAAMAISLSWSKWDVRNAVLAGLLCDCGMMLIPEDIRRADRTLDEAELNRMRRHPAMSVTLLEAMTDLPEVVALCAFQHHEREDGSGYPSALTGRRIHPIARMVAVADTYAGMTAPRPHRTGIQPYLAMEQIIGLASNGKLERAYTRTLVRVCGLFPVGSYVRLSDETLAIVVGSHPTQVDRPIVRRVRGGVMSEAIDLSTLKPWELSVLEPIDARM